MKILTNIQCGSPEELARHTFVISWRDYLGQKKEKIQLVAADVHRAEKPDERPEMKVLFEDRYFKFVACRGVGYDSLREIFGKACALDEFKEFLSPVIEGYRSIIRNEKPDVVLINCTYYLPWCLYIAAKEEGVEKIAIHYHGIMKKEAEGYDDRTRKILDEMEKSFHDDGDLAIFPSLFAKNTVEKEVTFGRLKRWAVVPNPVPDYFFDCPTKIKGKGENIGAVMRWSKIKNPEFLEKLAGYGAEQGKKYKINIVGRPLDKEEPLYIRMKKNIDFIDNLPNRELAQFYSKMDLIVCPSRFETYGNVAQEAIASGTPALVSPNMGIVDLYREVGIANWIVDFCNFEEAVEAIERASFETVSPSLRSDLRERLNTKRVFDCLYEAILNC